MSDRGRSRLFGRPSELLVDEGAPRISMPSPPARARTAPERTEPPRPVVDPSEEDSVPAGPLQVFVGPPGNGPPMSAAPAKPAAAVPPPPPPEVRLPSRPVAAPVVDAAPGMLMTDAMDQIGDVFGRRPPPARPPEPPQTDSGIRLAVRSAPRGFGSETTSPPGSPPRSQGIPTAAARARPPRVEARPPATFDDEEHTNVGLSPFEIFDTPRKAGERREAARAPEWDDPRFRKAEPSDLPVGTARPTDPRAPRVPTLEEHTRETTLTGAAPAPFGDLPVTRAPEPPAAPAPLPPAPLPLVAQPAREPAPRPLRPPPRRLQVALGAALLVLVAGLGAWRWERTHPGTFARLRARAPTAATQPLSGSAAPPVEAASASAATPAPLEPPAPVAEAPPPALVVEAPSPAPEPVVVAPVEAPVAAVPAPAAPVPAAVTPVSAAPPAPAALPVSSSPPVAVAATPNVAERRGNFEQATGQLHVLCNRKATIYVDNVKMGSTDGAPLELTAGTHRVKVVASNGRSRWQDVRIDAGRPSMLRFELR